MLGVATGAVAGLVAITPGAGFVTPLSAIIIGGGGRASLCLFCRSAQNAFGWATMTPSTWWGCTGLAARGARLATGLFASAAVGGTDGLFAGNPWR